MPVTFSPLRYPGGKSKLYNTVRPIISRNLDGIENKTYIEPFAGGCGLALKLLYSGDVDEIVLNDFDQSIYKFWNACLLNTEELCNRILLCNLTMEEWNAQHEIYINQRLYPDIDVAFATFFMNRCNVSGIIRGGPIGGRNQDGVYGIDARFNRQRLISLVRRVADNAHKIHFYNLDVLDFFRMILPHYSNQSSFLNIDPPYVTKGPALYKNSFTDDDHRELSRHIAHLQYKWIVTYDDCALIRRLYSDYQKEIVTLNYSAGRSKKGTELLIYGNNVE